MAKRKRPTRSKPIKRKLAKRIIPGKRKGSKSVSGRTSRPVRSKRKPIPKVVRPITKRDKRASEQAQKQRYQDLLKKPQFKGYSQPEHPESALLPPSHPVQEYDLCNPAEREILFNQIASDMLGLQDKLSEFRDPTLSPRIRISIQFSSPGSVPVTKFFQSPDTLRSFLIVDTQSPSVLINPPDWSEAGLCGYEKTILLGVAKFGKVEHFTPETMGALTEDERALVERRAGFKGYDKRYPIIKYRGAIPGESEEE